MKPPPDLPIRLHHQRHEPLHRHRERKPAAELECRQPQHGPQVAAEALGRAVLETVRHVRHRQPRRLEQPGRVQQPDGGEVVLRRGQPRPREPRHQRARPHRELGRERRHGGHLGREPDHRLDEEPRVGRRLGQGLEDRLLDPRHRARGRLAHDLAQPAPAGRRGDVHHLPHPRRAEPQQHLDGPGIVLRDQRDGGDRRELPHQVAQHLHLIGAAAVDGDQHRVHRPLPDHPHRVGDRVPVQHGEEPVAGGVHPRALARQEHGGDGGGAGIGDWGHAFLRRVGARG